MVLAFLLQISNESVWNDKIHELLATLLSSIPDLISRACSRVGVQGVLRVATYAKLVARGGKG